MFEDEYIVPDQESNDDGTITNYGVNVYWLDDDTDIWHFHGTWAGQAENDADARKKALDDFEDERIDYWKAEISWRPTTPA